jgi:two-component sensor histidine kinase
LVRVISMTEQDAKTEQVEKLLATPDLAGVLESEQFKRFLDQVPIAIGVSEMKVPERIVYTNLEFEKVTGQLVTAFLGKPWTVLTGYDDKKRDARTLGEALIESADFVGTFVIERTGIEPACVDAYSNVIEDDSGTPCYRFAALIGVGAHKQEQSEFEQKLREKDTLLREVQHRVKNNLQMITALLRLEARNARGNIDTTPFDRLAGRIEAIKLLYGLLSSEDSDGEIDLGVYLGEIASAVMRSHAVEGIRLDLKVDAYPVSVNVAMPTGLVVNELLTNALKHAFVGRGGGTIRLHSLSDGKGCQITIADDGVGLPDGVEWPKRGKLSALIVESLRENAKARFELQSSQGRGVCVKIDFTRAAAAPEAGG